MSEIPNLSASLVKALAELTVVAKGRTANAGSYTYEYASLEDVVKITRPVLAKHDLVALTPVHDYGSGLACTVTLLHSSGERLDLGPFPFPAGRDAQSTGSAVTYHVRYSLVAALGMAAGDDDDGAHAPNSQRQHEARDSRTYRSAYNELIHHLGGPAFLELASNVWKDSGAADHDPNEAMSEDAWAAVMATATKAEAADTAGPPVAEGAF